MRLLFAIALAIISLGYFIPFCIALVRDTRNLLAILLLNFFLGWTFIGWIVAAIWAITEKTDAYQPQANR